MKTFEIEYTDIRAGLAKLILREYMEEIVFDEPENIDSVVTKDLQDKLDKNLIFKTKVEGVVFENNALTGKVYILSDDDDDDTIVLDFHVAPSGVIFSNEFN